MKTRKPIAFLITDLDDTLWDWLEIWHAGFRPFLDAVSQKLQLPAEKLKTEIREIHQAEGTSEYSFLLGKMPSVRERFAPDEIVEQFRDAILAHREGRRRATRLFPGVLKTLMELKSKGVVLVAYSDSLSFYSKRRIRNTNLDGVLDFAYFPPDHGPPPALELGDVREMPGDYYELSKTQVRLTPKGKSKPAPEILKKILNDLSADEDEVLYIGDDVRKDVGMAQAVGVHDVFANYRPEKHDLPSYQLLREVSHWTDEMVKLDRLIRKPEKEPTAELGRGFHQLTEIFEFGR
ncbi:MAG: HAD family hydrolase [Myxococcota bacterium]